MFLPQESFQANETTQPVFPLDWKGIGVSEKEAKAASTQERARIAEQTQDMIPSGNVEQDGSLVFDLSGAELEVITLGVPAEAPTNKSADTEQTRLKEAAEAIREATGQDNWIARWTDEETIFAVLKDADMRERAVISQLYQDQYGISLEDEIKRSVSGADEDRALNLLNRMDGSANDLHAATIHTDLIDINQKFFGRKRSELETEIRNIFASKNSEEIAELESAYRAKFGVGLREQIASNEKMSQATKDAIGVYFKGVDGRSDADMMKLAENALQTRNVGRFQEAMRDAGAEARQKFLDEGGAEKILAAFGVANGDDINGGYVQTKDSLNALDYAEHGKLSAAQQVRDNTGVFHFTSNTNGIEAAIGAMTADERQTYELGKAVNDGRAVGTAVSESDRSNALAFYKELNGAMHEVGNQSELLAWEDQISNQGGTIISALARHRGTIYDDSVDEMCSTVESMSQADWERLKDPARGGEFRQQIEAMLKTYASASETARVMEIVDKKAALASYAEASTARRSLTNALDDRTHWFGPNDSEGILDDISKMSVQEQERYRTDTQYRKVVNEAVEDKLSGTAEDAAHGLLQKVLRGEKPEQDLVTTLQLRASDSMAPWARVQAVRRDLQKYFDADEALFERIKNPKTAEDLQLSQQICELASKSLPKEYLDNYIKPMLERGSIDLEKVIALDMMNGEREKVLADLAEAPADRREDLSAKLNETEIARLFNPDELAVMKNVLEIGRMDTADALRAKIVGWGQKDEIMDCLRQLNPTQLEEVKAGYARKYSEDLLADLLDKLGGERKLEAERILLSNNRTEEEKLSDLMQQGSQSHSGFGAGFTDNVCDVGTGYQIDAAINDTVQRMAEAAKSGRKLTGEELQDIQSRFLDVNRNYRDSKAAAADNAVNAAMAVAAIGGAAVTGGSSLALLGAIVPTGAALKFGTKALILGSDYDYTTGQVITDLATGGINAGANVVGAAQLGALFGVEKATMGAVTEIGLSAAAGGFGGGLSRFAESVAQQQSGQEILDSTLSGTATGALFAGALGAATVGLRNAWGAIAPGAADDINIVAAADDGSIVRTAGGDVFTSVEGAARTGDALTDAISAGARAKGFADPDAFAIANLRNPDEIKEFLRSYSARYPDRVLTNIVFAQETGNLAAGSQNAWRDAINDLYVVNGAPLPAPVAGEIALVSGAVDAPVVSAAADDLRAANIDAPAPRSGNVLREALIDGAKDNGYPNLELFAVRTLKDPAEIAEFARAYHAQHGDAALLNMWKAQKGRYVSPGTEDVWNSVINDLRSRDAVRLPPSAAAETPLVHKAAEAPVVSTVADDLRVAKVDAPAPSIAPEMAESVARTQGFVNASANADAVLPMKKQLYNVRFEQVTEPGGRLVQTLENATGEAAPQGSWIATRLDAAGNPVIERGVVNSWPLEAAKVVKTYNVTLEELQATTRLIAPTRVDGPIVHMVQLEEPIRIITKWGPMNGKAGDWLANYDFDPVTGEAGKSYAIVTAESYAQTYQPVK